MMANPGKKTTLETQALKRGEEGGGDIWIGELAKMN